MRVKEVTIEAEVRGVRLLIEGHKPKNVGGSRIWKSQGNGSSPRASTRNASWLPPRL